MKSITGIFKKALFVIALCAFLVPATTHASFLSKIKSGLENLSAQVSNLKGQLTGSAIDSLDRTKETSVRSTVAITSLKNDLGEGVAGGFTRDAVAIKKLLLEKSLRGSTTTGVPLSVDLKINGSGTPAAVVDRSKMTATWTTTGASICFAAGHNAPTWDKSTVWPQVAITPGAGSQDLMAALAFNGNMSDLRSMTQLTIMLQCFGEDGSNIVDQVVVPVIAAAPACVIKSLSADPKTVNTGGSATLSWTTTGCTSVKIGDDPTIRPANGSMSTGPLTRTTTYTIKASDINGKITTLGGPVYEGPVFPVIVRVKTTPIATPSITVTSPNGGETFIQGQTNTITWKNGNSYTKIGLATSGSTLAPSSLSVVGWINTNVAPGTTSITWDGKTVTDLAGTATWRVTPGQYKIIASGQSTDGTGNYCASSNSGSAEETCNADLSNGAFTIVAPTKEIIRTETPIKPIVKETTPVRPIVTPVKPVRITDATPTVTVTSPNGGETYTMGQKVLVTWDVTNFNSANTVFIGYKSSLLSEGSELTITANDGQEMVTMPLRGGQGEPLLPTGKYYKIYIALGGNPALSDVSDETFTLINPSLDTTPRIMYWQGKVNQHVDAQGNWQTDPDGVSGAELNKLNYCKKWYPNTTSVQEGYKSETITTWHERTNINNWTATKMSDKCVQGTSQARSLIVTNPKGGEVYQNGNQITIKWKSAGYGSQSLLGIDLAKQDASGGNSNTFLMSANHLVDDGTETLTIPVNVPAGNSYIIHLEIYDPATGLWQSANSGMFTIQSSTSVKTLEVITESPAGITSTTAIFQGSYKYDYTSTFDGWWEYGTTTRLGTKTDLYKQMDLIEPQASNPPTEGWNGGWGTRIEGLKPDTTYYVKACGKDKNNTIDCGDVLQFKTLISSSIPTTPPGCTSTTIFSPITGERCPGTTPPVTPATCPARGLPSLIVVSPNGGELYRPGQDIIVNWSACNFVRGARIAIDLISPSGVATTLLTSTGNDGTQVVTLPVGVSGDGYKIQVRQNTNLGTRTPKDQSDRTFSIIGTVEAETLVVSLASDTPPQQVVEVSSTSRTDDIVLLKGKLKLTGNSDARLNKLPLTLSTPNGASIYAIVDSVGLWIDGEEIGEVSLNDSSATSAVVVFDGLDFVLNAGDTYTFTVKARINEITPVSFDEGDSVTASVTDINRGAIDIEDVDANDFLPSQKIGNALGNSQTFLSQGILVTPVVNTAEVLSVDGAADYAIYTMKVNITAFNEDVYIDKSFIESASISTTPVGSNRVNVANSSGVQLTNGFSASISSTDNDAREMQNSYKISDGSTASFTITVTARGTNAIQRAILYALEWGTSDAATLSHVYTSGMGLNGDYKTNLIYVSGV